MTRSLMIRAGGLLLAISAASGQNQTFYVGRPATGDFKLYRSASLRQLGATFLLRSAVAEGNSDLPPKLQPRLHPPLTGASQPSLKTTGLTNFAALLSRAAASSAAAVAPGLVITPSTPAVGFNGLTHADQRMANNGNQFSVEPANTSIAVGNGYVLEGVNNAVQVYNTAGQPLLPKVLSTNELFGLAPAVIRAPLSYGPFPTDMRVFYDAPTDRYFVMQRVHDNDTFGNSLNLSHIYLAVSQTGDPTGAYNMYVADTTNASNSGCPCFSDYPQIGADQYGFYISANEYDTRSESFVDAVIYALSKSALATGASTPAAYKFTLPFQSGYEFAVQPATTPPGASYFIGNGGMEYFASTVGSFSAGNSVAIWAMWNTSSLTTGNPAPQLARINISTLAYTWPDVAVQPEGKRPYGMSLIPPGTLPLIDPGDTRVLSLSYSGGELSMTFASRVTDEMGRTLAGGALVQVMPTMRSGVLSAYISRQGYLMASNGHLLFPVVAVNAQRRGAIAVTLVGTSWFPSAAYIPFEPGSLPTSLRILAAGTAPEDGFTGYPGGTFPGLARWGDYSAATVAPDGSLWVGVEYIGSLPRTELANWQTYISRVAP